MFKCSKKIAFFSTNISDTFGVALLKITMKESDPNQSISATSSY